MSPRLFALASAAAAGTGFAWATEPSAELAELRERAAFVEAITERIAAMTPAERRQLDRLMAPASSTKR